MAHEKFSSVAREAAKLVAGIKEDSYGNAYEDWKRVGALWGVVLADHVPGQPVAPKTAALMMVLLKVAREHHKSKRDNRVDIAGYAEVLELIQHNMWKL